MAMHLTEVFSRGDTESAAVIALGNQLGVSMYTEAQQTARIQHLHRLDELSQSTFQQALQLAAQSKNVRVAAYVVMKVAHAAGNRFIHLNGFGANERATQEKLLCKTAYGVAKDLYATIRDRRGLASALHNLANDIRFFGEIEEAKALTQEVMTLARELGDTHLLDDAEALMRRLISGRVPDYVHGEDRNAV
jgi:hypothetical protein